MRHYPRPYHHHHHRHHSDATHEPCFSLLIFVLLCRLCELPWVLGCVKKRHLSHLELRAVGVGKPVLSPLLTLKP